MAFFVELESVSLSNPIHHCTEIKDDTVAGGQPLSSYSLNQIVIKILCWFISNITLTNIHGCTCCWPINPEAALPPEVLVPLCCTIQCHPSHWNAAAHIPCRVWPIPRGQESWYCRETFGSLKSELEILFFYPVLEHNSFIQVFTCIILCTSGNNWLWHPTHFCSFHFFLLADLQTSLFANHSFLQTQKPDEAAYNWLHWNSIDIKMIMSWFCSTW